MPRTEIDDIFASKPQPSLGPSAKAKGKAKAIVIPSESANAVEKKRKKKKNVKALDPPQTIDTPPVDATFPTPKRKRTEPETILDPSMPSKKLKAAAITLGGDTSTRTGKSRNKIVEDEGKFRDSRGTGPRKKTEEGFSVYKEDELGIGDQGGDTPLCPFDCDCCF